MSAIRFVLTAAFMLVGLFVCCVGVYGVFKLASPVASHLLCRLEVETNEERGQYMNVHEQSLAQEREEAARAKEEQA